MVCCSCIDPDVVCVVVAQEWHHVVETRWWSVSVCIMVGAQEWPATYLVYYGGAPGMWSATCFRVFEHHGGDNSGGVSGYTWYGDDGPHLSEPGQ